MDMLCKIRIDGVNVVLAAVLLAACGVNLWLLATWL
jgi:hypothetical protein